MDLPPPAARRPSVKIADQIDALILLFTTVLFYLVFSFSDLTKPELQIDEHVENIGLQMSEQAFQQGATRLLPYFYDAVAPYNITSATIGDYMVGDGSIVDTVYQSLICAITLDDPVPYIVIDVGIAVSVIICAYLYAIKSGLKEDETFKTFSPCKYFLVFILPGLATLAFAIVIGSLNFIWSICFTGSEMSVAGVLIGFYILILIMPLGGYLVHRCGCVPDVPIEEANAN